MSSSLLSSSLFAYFFTGHIEWIIIGVVILLLFGHRLPSLMRSMGRGVVEFKQGLHGDAEEEAEEEPAGSNPQSKAHE